MVSGTYRLSSRIMAMIKMSRVTMDEQPPPDPVPMFDEQVGTRERILDIALDLFTGQGYEKTSLRQIAERLGFSKAAIYYHFASKEDILMALHMRLHEFGRGAPARSTLRRCPPWGGNTRSAHRPDPWA